MMKYILSLVVAMTFAFGASAQHFELGILAGGSVYEGDLAPSSSFVSFGETKFAFGAFARYTPQQFVSIKLGITRGSLTASDTDADSDDRNRRNLSFRSNITEFALTGEFNILGYAPCDDRNFTPYIYAGVAMYKYNPQTQLNGQWIDLQPLGTEGQGIDGKAKYGLTQFSIPVGFGVKYSPVEAITIGLDVGVRKTFNDYLDDVSGTYADRQALLDRDNGETLAADLADRTWEFLNITPQTINEAGTQRGDASDDDWYFVGGLTLSVNFGGSCPGIGGGGKYGCPTF